jgi:hypothetical protein
MGLRAHSETPDGRFRRGIVLYTGKSAVPFGEILHTLPVSSPTP